MALSVSWLKANAGKERSKRTEKSDRDGLSVRVSEKGKIKFQIRFYLDGKQHRCDIGTYPLMTLQEARQESMRYRSELEQGRDPRIVRKMQRQSIGESYANTLSKLFYRWYESYCMENKKGHVEIRRSFELHVLPHIGELPVDKITLQRWLEVLEPLAKDMPGITDRVLVNSKQMLNWAVKRQMIAQNVLITIGARHDLKIKKNVTYRSLSDEELGWLFEALNNSRIEPKNKLFVELCLIYGCRNGELRLSKKSDFDFESGIWTVPPENHKGGLNTNRPLLRPITEVTAEKLRLAMTMSSSEYLFTNANSSTPMGKSSPIAIPYNLMQWLRRRRGIEMAHWSMHDLRKTARTNFSTICDPHVAEIMLGHKLPGVWQTYDHHEYLEEQKVAYELWCEKLIALSRRSKTL